jgi:anti-sigma factor RsiW
MNCAEFRYAIVDLARQRSPAGDEPRVAKHLAECPACAALLKRERTLSAALRGLAEETAAERAPDAVEERLVAMFAAQRAPAGVMANSRRWWIPVAAGLALAAASVAWWLGGPGSRRLEPAAPAPLPVQASTATPTPSIEPAPDPQTTAHDLGREVLAPRPSAHRQARVLRPAGFMVIPSAVGLPDFESGEIVRTRIPVSSLPVYGVEIVPDAAGTPVEADLLVGQDGRARAIRLVTTDSRDTRSRR